MDTAMATPGGHPASPRRANAASDRASDGTACSPPCSRIQKIDDDQPGHHHCDTITGCPRARLRADGVPMMKAAVGAADALAPIERLPEEILMLVLAVLDLKNRVSVARVSKTLNAVATLSMNVHPAVLDARWFNLAVDGEDSDRRFQKTMDIVAAIWHRHRGINAVLLPWCVDRVDSIRGVASELDRVQIGVRSIELYAMTVARDGAPFCVGGPDFIDREEGVISALPVALEPSAHGENDKRGTAAVTRLITANFNQYVGHSRVSLGDIQHLFPALRDFMSAGGILRCHHIDREVQTAQHALRPFRVLHLRILDYPGHHGEALFDECIAAIVGSPSLTSLALRNVQLDDKAIKSIAMACPALRYCRLIDCDPYAGLVGLNWRNHLCERLPECRVRIEPDLSYMTAFSRSDI